MSMVRYSTYRKKQAGGRCVWGVLRLEGRKQYFRTAGEDDDAQEKAEKLAKRLSRMEVDSTDANDRFLSWHRAGEPLPLDRTVRDYARTAKHTVASSTAARYRQFAERLVGLPAPGTGGSNAHPEPAKNRIGCGLNTGGWSPELRRKREPVLRRVFSS